MTWTKRIPNKPGEWLEAEDGNGYFTVLSVEKRGSRLCVDGDIPVGSRLFKASYGPWFFGPIPAVPEE